MNCILIIGKKYNYSEYIINKIEKYICTANQLKNIELFKLYYPYLNKINLKYIKTL